MQVKTPTFSLVILFLTGAIATALGVVASLFTQNHPMYFEGAEQLLLSWSGRELGQGLIALIVVALFRDPRAVIIALGTAWIREVIDFIDFFRLPETPIRMYFVVGTSVILHSAAIYLVWNAILRGKEADASQAGVAPA